MDNSIFMNNKDLISRLNQYAMAYSPALELDREINLLSNVYYSTVTSLLHFGEGELNFRKGERFDKLKLSPPLVPYFNEQLEAWNNRGISIIDTAIETIREFVETGSLSRESVNVEEFRDMRLRISEVLAESPLKASDTLKLINAFDEVVSKASTSGEFGFISFMQEKLVELKEVRQSPSRGTEDNIPVWKLIGAIVIFGFPVFKALRCILRNRCCNTVSGLEGVIVFVAALAWTLC